MPVEAYKWLKYQPTKARRTSSSTSKRWSVEYKLRRVARPQVGYLLCFDTYGSAIAGGKRMGLNTLDDELWVVEVELAENPHIKYLASDFNVKYFWKCYKRGQEYPHTMRVPRGTIACISVVPRKLIGLGDTLLQIP